MFKSEVKNRGNYFFVRIQPPFSGLDLFKSLLLLRGVHLAVTQFAFPSSEGPYRSPISAQWHIGTIPLLHSSLIPHVSVNQRTKLRATRRSVCITVLQREQLRRLGPIHWARLITRTWKKTDSK